MTEPRGGTYRMANRLAEGRLPDLLGVLRSHGNSWDDIGRRLHSDFGIDVTAETLRAWAKVLDISEPAA